MAGQVATEALAQATEAADDWAIGWALHVLILEAVMQGRMTESLPLFERALAVTQADPSLIDLWLLLQVNKAVTLGDLDQYEGAFTAARKRSSWLTGPASRSAAPRPTAVSASCCSIPAAGLRPWLKWPRSRRAARTPAWPVVTMASPL